VLPAAEVARLAEECARLDREIDREALCGPLVTPRRGADGSRFFDRLDPATPWSPAFAALVGDPRLTDPVAAVLGDTPLAFKDKILWRPPGTGGYALHTDYDYWPGLGAPADAALSAVLAIDAARPESGAIELFPGLHRAPLPALPGSPLDVDPAAVAGAPSVFAVLEPGDLLLFHSALPHRSGANASRVPRCSFFVSYGAARGGNLRLAYERGRRAGAARQALTAKARAGGA
jgi:ectoine hydroxylase-related dioxygenase (phytanoyl-CoA dioxygenase family)